MSAQRQSTEVLTVDEPVRKAYDWFGIISFLVILFGSIVVSLVSSLTSGRPELAIHAQWVPETDSIGFVRGTVLTPEGAPVAGARVWVVVEDRAGNRASPPVRTTDEEGRFSVDSVPRHIADNPVYQATINARVETEGDVHTGQETIVDAATRGFGGRRVALSIWKIAYVPGIFLASILLAFMNVPLQLKHNLCLVLALAFTVIMIFAISLALRLVHTAGEPGYVLSLGFASIFHGTYVAGGGGEWIFSFTEAAEARTKAPGIVPLVHGFGAPLWVMLLGVIGAALKTVQIVVREITDRPDYDDPDKNAVVKKVREHIQDIIRHQFYILFAPIGAVFVYQALVVGDAANNALTVAVATLGAGASLNALLERAVTAARGTAAKAGAVETGATDS